MQRARARGKEMSQPTISQTHSQNKDLFQPRRCRCGNSKRTPPGRMVSGPLPAPALSVTDGGLGMRLPPLFLPPFPASVSPSVCLTTETLPLPTFAWRVKYRKECTELGPVNGPERVLIYLQSKCRCLQRDVFLDPVIGEFCWTG